MTSGISRIVHNITMPIAPFCPVGSVFPWDSPHQREDIVTVKRNRAHLFHIQIGSGTGTRLRSEGYGRAGGTAIAALPRDQLTNREAAVLRIPKGADEAITADDVASALQASGEWTGLALLIVTGWGDSQRYSELGEAYVTSSPHFDRDAATMLASELRRRQVPVLLTDCADVDDVGAMMVRSDWLAAPAWQRPPWPSDQAKTYLRHYDSRTAREDRVSTLALTEAAPLIVGLVGCGAVGGDCVRITALAWPVEDVGEGLCTVVAESFT